MTTHFRAALATPTSTVTPKSSRRRAHGRAIAILATVIRHEQEHLRGANEQDARRAERDFFRRLIQGGRVPVDQGVAYLNILQTQHPLREGV